MGEGFRIARHGDGEPSLALSELDPEGPLEAALLFKRTGTLVAGWTRTNARQDVLSVMAATLFASAATIVEALGDSNPASAAVETDLRRMLAVKTGSQYALLLVASKAVSEGVLRQLAKKLIRDAPAQRTSHDPRASVMVKP